MFLMFCVLSDVLGGPLGFWKPAMPLNIKNSLHVRHVILKNNATWERFCAEDCHCHLFRMKGVPRHPQSGTTVRRVRPFPAKTHYAEDYVGESQAKVSRRNTKLHFKTEHPIQPNCAVLPNFTSQSFSAENNTVLKIVPDHVIVNDSLESGKNILKSFQNARVGRFRVQNSRFQW